MILDTGVMVATFDARDVHHREATLFLAGSQERLVVPAPVVFETAQFVGGRRGLNMGPFVEAEAVRVVSALGVVDPTVADYERAVALLVQYADQDSGRGIGVVDALVIAIAERLRETMVATYDRKHFQIIRPAHVAAFELYP